MLTIDQYLVETYQAYVEQYNRNNDDDVPPGDFDWWVETHGAASIRDAVDIGHFTTEEGDALLSALDQHTDDVSDFNDHLGGSS